MASTDLFDTAMMTMGFYPQAVWENNAWRYRTDFENGWNAALIAVFESHQRITDWYTAFPQSAQEFVLDMFRNDHAWTLMENGAVTFCLNMSDIFAYAAADYEVVPDDQLAVVQDMYNQYNFAGLVAWVAYHRNTDPMRTDDNYYAARAYLG